MSEADYFFSDTVYDPSNDPVVKLAVCVGIGWGIYVCLNSGKKHRQTPQRRKHRASLTLGHIDKQIDGRNFSIGKKVISIPDVPFYSRHNYNRRRRPTMVS